MKSTARDDQKILERIAGFTMTSVERQVALIQAVRYIARRGIPGAFVECGVWKGGSAMAIALTLLDEGDTEREIFLFDTFEGMTAPTEVDRSMDGWAAQEILGNDAERTGVVWAVAGLEEVRSNMNSTDYPASLIRYVRGPVESTIPCANLGGVALLRLDTDWYNSTRHELEHLFPLINHGGILIVDDYGHWEGARKATDEYFEAQHPPYYMHRIDYTGRLIVKC